MIVPESDLHSEVYKLVKAAIDKKNKAEEENSIDNGKANASFSSPSPATLTTTNYHHNHNTIYDVYMCVDEMEIEEDEAQSGSANTKDLVYEELVKQENAAILCYTELSYIAYDFIYCSYLVSHS